MENKKLSLLGMSVVVGALLVASFTSCEVEPPLHLYDGIDIDFPELPRVDMDVDVVWEYDFETTWKSEWEYGWDTMDSLIFGKLGYSVPVSYEIRRYFNGQDSVAPHNRPMSYHLDGTNFKASYEFGWYDMLLWNTIQTDDGVQSIIIDESDYDKTIARTNKTMYSVRGVSELNDQTYYQPEDMYAEYVEKIHISANVEDYDYYDPVSRVYYKKLHGVLQPITYIYLPQLIIHNNHGRIASVDGNAVLTGMSYSTCVNTGVTGDNAINVYFNTRIKNDVILQHEHAEEAKNRNHKRAGEDNYIGEKVDIIGGRLTTFGICNTNPYENKTRATIHDTYPHYIGLTIQFNNGIDSTMVFDVTEDIRKHYRGGVITMELDMDTVPLPQRSGGSGFDAVVMDYEEETHEFEM